MMDILLERNRSAYFDYFGLTKNDFFKTRIKYIAFFLFLYLLILVVRFDLILLFLTPLVILFGYKLPYYNLTQLKKREDLIGQHLFSRFLTTFTSLVKTQGNVYLTLVACLDYIDYPLNDELQLLIDRLDDPRYDNRTAFIQFAEYINTPEAFNIMNTINSFDEGGIDTRDLESFETLIMNIENEKKEEMIERKVSAYLHIQSNPVMIYAVFYIMALIYAVWNTTLSSINF